jgi:hypothetical protein
VNVSPIVMVDLNINVEHPRDKREAAIPNLLDKINFVDMSPHLSGAACKGASYAGHGIRIVGDTGSTLSQTILWHGKGIFRNFGRLASNHHQSTTLTTVQLWLT